MEKMAQYIQYFYRRKLGNLSLMIISSSQFGHLVRGAYKYLQRSIITYYCCDMNNQELDKYASSTSENGIVFHIVCVISSQIDGGLGLQNIWALCEPFLT